MYPRIVFAGVHMEARAPLQRLIDTGENVAGLVTFDVVRRAKISGAVDLTTPAAAAGIPVLEAGNINDAEALDWVRRLAPDLLLVVGWTQLLREPMLAVPKLACLGFHASLLPRYRGRAPINWALINGETETGNTMIVLEPGADVGDIVAQRRIAITDEDDCRTLYEKVAATEVEMIDEVLPLIRRGTLPRRKQDEAQATVMPRRRPEDGLIDWTLDARRLHNWVRALTHPYPGAFTYMDGRKIWIWKATECGDGEPGGPGAVRLDPSGWPIVGTTAGALRLISVQREGEPEMSGRDAWRRGAA